MLHNKYDRVLHYVHFVRRFTGRVLPKAYKWSSLLYSLALSIMVFMVSDKMHRCFTPGTIRVGYRTWIRLYPSLYLSSGVLYGFICIRKLH